MLRRSRKTSTLYRLKTRLMSYYAGLFVAPSQSRLVTVLGGTVIVVGRLRNAQGYPLTITLSRGRLLRSERFRRSVVDDTGMLANDIKWAIQVQGSEYERNVLEAFERDEYLKEKGWIIKYIPESWLYNKPELVKHDVEQFFFA